MTTKNQAWRQNVKHVSHTDHATPHKGELIRVLKEVLTKMDAGAGTSSVPTGTLQPQHPLQEIPLQKLLIGIESNPEIITHERDEWKNTHSTGRSPDSIIEFIEEKTEMIRDGEIERQPPSETPTDSHSRRHREAIRQTGEK